MSVDDPVLLDRTLRPSPPMPPAALAWVVVAVAVIYFVFALVFVLHGAWLITPFMGLDVALLAWAFRASLRASRCRERVLLTQSQLTVERHPVRGPASEVALNPYWVRVDMADPPEPGSQLTLWSHGKGVRVGSFLAPGEKLALAQTLKSALRRARGSV
ncbi:MAG TPA: DUF2244 domain-containing protein [Rhizomicrobium sp.]|nr:DUF2244 domain-containing protein [Rhizomicrobium sp.]